MSLRSKLVGLRGLSLWAAGVAAAVGTAQAQTAGVSSDSIQEIVVTAERRETNLQETPLAMSVVSGAELTNKNLNTLQDISFEVPAFQFGVSTGQAHPAIRGIGASDIIFGADPRIAFYLDDVYVARPEAQLAALFDVDQVQVLNGPQGTLYGRNATGGALLVTSRKPTDTVSGYVNLTGGNYGTAESEAALSGPLTEGLDGRIAVQTIYHNGYGTNLLTGSPVDNENQKSVRTSLLWKMNDDFNFLLQGDYHYEHDRDYAEHYGGYGNVGTPPIPPLGPVLGGFLPGFDSRDVANTIDPFNKREIWGANGTATWHLGQVTLKSITAYRHQDTSLFTNIDSSSLSLAQGFVNQTARQVSEELQATADVGRSHITAGVLYFDEHLVGKEPVGLNLLIFGGPNILAQGVNQAGTVTTQSDAAYIRYGLDVTDQLSFTLGGRYTYEKKTIFNQFGFDLMDLYNPNAPVANMPPFPYGAEKSYNAFTPSGSLEYKFTRHVFGYLTVTEGFKSGGFNIGVFQPPFQPEKIWDYEAGLKSTWLNDKLQANVSAFYYNYNNLQVSIVQGTQVIIENAAKAKLYGGELQLVALPVQDFRIDAAIAALHSEYVDFMTTDPANPQNGIQNLDGNQLTQAPKFTVNVGAEYTWHSSVGALALRGEYRWVDDIFFTPFDTENAWTPRHGIGNAYLRFNDNSSRWSAVAFVHNLANKVIVADAYTTTLLIGSPVAANLEPPRTYGLKIGYSF